MTAILRTMRSLPRSKARRDREALVSLGEMMAAGFAEGIRKEEARMAAIPDGVSREEWARAGMDEAMANLDADPTWQRMAARTRTFWGLPDPG